MSQSMFTSEQWQCYQGTNDGLTLGREENEEECENDENVWSEEVKQLKAYRNKKENVVEAAGETNNPSNVLHLIACGLAGAAPTKNNVLVLNRILICILKQIESQLKHNLQQNKLQQEEILDNLKEFSKQKKVVSSPSSISLLKCGMPFFKLPNGWGQPQNQYAALNALNCGATPEQHYKPVFCWSSRENKKLNDLVTAHYKEIMLSKYKNLLPSCHRLGSNRKALRTAVKKLEALQKAGPAAVDPTALDWLRIETSLGSEFSADECQAQWMLVVRPSINRERWTAQEERKLVQIARDHFYEGWDQIAQELGTGRSGLQCCITFQRLPKASPEWTAQENAKLISLYKRFKFSNIRPFIKVALFFENRTMDQIRYHCKLLLRKAIPADLSFKVENAVLTMTHSGPDDARRMCMYLPGRSWLRIKRKLDNLEDMKSFSCDEDQKLFDAVRKSGKDWSYVCSLLPERPLKEIQYRFFQLLHLAEDILDLVDVKKSSNDIFLPKLNVGEDVYTLLQVLWEPSDHKNNFRYGQFMGQGLANRQLLRMLEFGGKHLFGPRYRSPRTFEEKTKMALLTFVIGDCLKTRVFPNDVAHRLLSLSQIDKNFIKPESLIFDMKEVNLPDLPSTIGQSLIPPNLITLVGARTIGSVKGMLTGQATLPIQHATTPKDSNAQPEDRILFSRARDLLKFRMISLFFLSLCMAKIPPTPGKFLLETSQLKTKPVHSRSSKLSRKRRAQQLNVKRWSAGDKNEDQSTSSQNVELNKNVNEHRLKVPSKAKMIRVTAAAASCSNKKARSTHVQILDSSKYVANIKFDEIAGPSTST